MGWDPVKKELSIPHNRGTPTVRAERGKEDIMVAGENVKVMLTIKGQDKVLGGTGGPPTPQKVEERLLGKEVPLETTDDLIQMRQRRGGNLGAD